MAFVTKMEHLTNIPNLLVQSGKLVLKFLTFEINFSEAQHQLCYRLPLRPWTYHVHLCCCFHVYKSYRIFLYKDSCNFCVSTTKRFSKEVL